LRSPKESDCDGEDKQGGAAHTESSSCSANASRSGEESCSPSLLSRSGPISNKQYQETPLLRRSVSLCLEGAGL
jgi:hypothetical protein